MFKHKKNLSIEQQSVTNGKSPKKPLKTNKVKLFQLGIFSLTFLMTTALILVGGSFSKNTSTGNLKPNLTLKAANFDITANIDESTIGEKYDKNSYQLVFCAFTISNNSDVNIVYDVDFSATITWENNSTDFNKYLEFFVADEATDIYGNSVTLTLSGEGSIESSWAAYITANDFAQYAFVVNCDKLYEQKNMHLINATIGGITITITAEQAGVNENEN